MRILAIDHGTKLVGWAIIDDGKIAEFDLVHMKRSYPETLVELDGLTRALMTLNNVSSVALERPMSLRGGHVAQTLIEHYAVCKLHALKLGLEIIEIAPPTIKLRVAGAGNADKQAVAEAICVKYGIELDKLCPPDFYKAGPKKGKIKSRSWDSSDAVALGLAAHMALEKESVGAK